MPDAFKCSKCGDLYEGTPEWSGDFEQLEQTAELCDGCLEKLLGWFDGHDVTSLGDYNIQQP